MASLASLKTKDRLLDRQAANSIRQQIVSGAMPPGHRLLEATLASELEVSRGTIRSALMQLANQGLVQQVAFTKWEVAAASISEAWELYTLRASLEGLGAGLAAQFASEDERNHLKDVRDELIDAAKGDDRDAATDADFKLHQTIVNMSGHKFLIQVHERVILQVRFQMTHIGFTARNYSILVEDHRLMADAVVDGDVARAEQLARDHNSDEVERLLVAGARGKPQEAESLIKVRRNTPAKKQKGEKT